ncbi:MAG TPA: signal peptidase I [Candidatus Aquicultor sp.]|jgi:signal peptidase I
MASARDRVRRGTLLDKALCAATITLVGVFLIGFTYIACGRAGLLIVKTDSMQPHMPAGSLMVFKTANIQSVFPGQIVVYRDGRSPNVLISHRVIGTSIDNGSVYLRTKGDSNNHTDEVLVDERRLVGAAVFVIPGVGRALAFARTPIGMLVLNTMLVLLVLLILVDKIRANERVRVVAAYAEGEQLHPRSMADRRAAELG